MSNRQDVSNLLYSVFGNANTIPVPAVFLELFEEYNTSVLLNQIIYWSDKTSRKDGYFYKTYQEWEEEIYLSEYQVRRSLKKLKELGFLETAVKKANGNPTVHYKLDIERFQEWLLKKLEERKGSNLDKRSLKNSGNDTEKIKGSLTKITTENTTENTTDKDQSSSKNTLKLISDKIPNAFSGSVNAYVVDDIEHSINDLGKEAYEIVEVAIDMTIEKAYKGSELNFLKKILNSWSKENVNTKEQALSKTTSKKTKAQKADDMFSKYEEKLDRGDQLVNDQT